MVHMDDGANETTAVGWCPWVTASQWKKIAGSMWPKEEKEKERKKKERKESYLYAGLLAELVTTTVAKIVIGIKWCI